MMLKRIALCGAMAVGILCTAGIARAADRLPAELRPADWRFGGKLLLTGGVTNIEGAGGGGLATWATITGYETCDGIGGNVHFTYVGVQDYGLRDFGASIGLFDRVELSYARQAFDTGSTGAKLGLGRGFTFHQDVWGVKVRVLGDAVYDQDTWLPQVAVGAQFKKNDRDDIVKAVGAKHDHGVDYYVAATKLFLAQSLLVNGTLRFTKANQTGLLGFGAQGHDAYVPEFEGSVGYLLSKRLVVGAEYRTKPDHLAFAKENDWYDLFAAFALNKHLSLTLAYADLGDIATFRNQKGVYVSVQAGF
jgi:hypothetical protein